MQIHKSTWKWLQNQKCKIKHKWNLVRLHRQLIRAQAHRSCACDDTAQTALTPRPPVCVYVCVWERERERERARESERESECVCVCIYIHTTTPLKQRWHPVHLCVCEREADRQTDGQNKRVCVCVCVWRGGGLVGACVGGCVYTYIPQHSLNSADTPSTCVCERESARARELERVCV